MLSCWVSIAGLLSAASMTVIPVLIVFLVLQRNFIEALTMSSPAMPSKLYANTSSLRRSPARAAAARLASGQP